MDGVRCVLDSPGWSLCEIHKHLISMYTPETNIIFYSAVTVKCIF